jgi:hypothetical protein
MPGTFRFTLALALLFVAAHATAADEPATADYINVEARGTLDHGIVAIGGETTGTVIHVGKVTWEIDLGGNPALLKLAEELNKKTVVVSGKYFQKQGVEIPVRHIVKVEKLKAAGK